MSLDLGALIGRVILETVEFDRTYVRVVRQFSELGTSAEKSAQGTATLDEALAAVGKSATSASAGLSRSTKATGEESAAAKRAAIAEQERAVALGRVAEVMAPLASATAKEQAATLRNVAAQERLTAVRQGATTEAGRQATATARVASAQASSIAAADRAAAAQRAASESTATGWLRARASLSGFVRTAGELGLIIGAVVAIKGALNIASQAADYQRQMLLIQTQTHGSAAEVQFMSGAVLNLAGKVGILPDKLAQAVYHFESIGVRGPAAMRALTIAAEGAQVGNANLDDTTQALVYTLQSGITGVSNLGQAMAVFNTIVGAGDMTMQQLVEAIGSHGLLANAKASGASIQEVGAALAVLGDNGVKGVLASTALIQIFNDLLKPANGSADALSKLGLSADDLRTAMSEHGLNAALQLLHSRLVAAGDTGTKLKGVLTDIFTKRASSNLAIVLGNMDLWNQKLAINTKAAGDFGSMWQETAQTSRVAWDKFTAGLDATGVRVASNLLPGLSKVAQYLGTELPVAASALSGVLSGPLSLAWHALAASIGLIGTVLTPILSVLNDFKGPLGTIATLVFGVWAAFKLGAAIPGILDAIALRAMYMGDSFVAAKGRVVGALTGVSAAAAATAADVDVAGEAATVGWRGLLGPLAAVAVGVGLLISMFHSSSSASKEAADAAKAYTDALNEVGSGKGDRSTILDAIIKQLDDNGVPGKIADLNKALGSTQFSGRQFVAAIQGGAPALDQLRAKLEAVIKAGTPTGPARGPLGGLFDRNGVTAAKQLLSDLTAQIDGMTAAQAKEITQLKAFGTVAAPIQTVADKLHLTGAEVTNYAGLLGLAVTKSGDLVDSTSANVSSIAQLGRIMAGASASVADLAKAWGTFAQSEGTAADRAALIGATLKAANGDALGYAASINATAVAEHQLATDMASAAKSIGKNGVSVAHLIGQIVDLKTGTINYHNAAAAPLINDLQAIQTAAMGAAQATYQHARQTMNGKDAADAAYKVYVNQTRGALIGEAKQLGLTSDQAGKLADQYFGMPKNVKTLIEAEGTDPILTVLNKIGALLAKVFGVPWTAKPKVDPTGAYSGIHAIDSEWMRRASHISRLWAALNADGSRANAEIASVADQWAARAAGIARLRPTIGVNDNASGPLGHIADYLSWLNGQTATVTVNEKTVGQLGSTRRSQVPAGSAFGGTITGAGGPKQDNIPAMLSVGEEVIQNPYAAMWRPLLKRINSGQFHGYASGGTAGSGGTNTDPLVTRTLYGPYGAGVQGIATLLRSQIPGAKAAMADLAKAVGEAFQLKGVEAQIAAIKTKLAAVTSYRDSVMSTVSSTFSSQQYGSVGDLLAGEKSDTANNNTIAAEIKKLTGEGLPMSYLSNLISQGQFTTLATLASANKGQIGQVAKAVNLDTSSLYGVGRAATLQKFGTTVGGVQGQLDTAEARQAQLIGGIDKLVAVVARVTGHPVSVQIAGHTIAEAVFRDSEFLGVLDELTHRIQYPRG